MGEFQGHTESSQRREVAVEEFQDHAASSQELQVLPLDSRLAPSSSAGLLASQVTSAFKHLAIQLQAEEGDFIALAMEGIISSAGFFFGLPAPEKLEHFLEDVV